MVNDTVSVFIFVIVIKKIKTVINTIRLTRIALNNRPAASVNIVVYIKYYACMV